MIASALFFWFALNAALKRRSTTARLYTRSHK